MDKRTWMGLIAAVCTMYGSEQSFDHDHVIGIFSMFTTGHLDFVKGFIEYWVEFIHLTVQINP